MNKNIFQETKIEELNKYDSIKISSECKVRFSTPGDSKKSIKSNKSNNSKESANSTLKEKITAPSMYKIALNLKKFTENKLKKVHQDASSNLIQKDELVKKMVDSLTDENNSTKNDREVAKVLLHEDESGMIQKNNVPKFSAEFDAVLEKEISESSMF